MRLRLTCGNLSSMIYSSPFPDARIPEVPLVDFVFANIATRANKLALIDFVTGRAVTYGQLADEIRSAAFGLVPGPKACASLHA